MCKTKITIYKQKRTKRNRGKSDKKSMESDYIEQLQKRCEEQQLRIEKLEYENVALRAKYSDLERTLESRIDAAVIQAVATVPLYAEISARDNEIVRLKALLCCSYKCPRFSNATVNEKGIVPWRCVYEGSY